MKYWETGDIYYCRYLNDAVFNSMRNSEQTLKNKYEYSLSLGPVSCLVFIWDLNRGPIVIRTVFDHLKSGLICYSEEYAYQSFSFQTPTNLSCLGSRYKPVYIIRFLMFMIEIVLLVTVDKPISKYLVPLRAKGVGR